MVWKHALVPRLVAVKPRPCLKENEKAKGLEISLLRGIPALLAVNQESRYLALRHYTWRFTMDVCLFQTPPRGAEKQRACVVMSPDDTLGLFRRKQDSGAGYNELSFLTYQIKAANEKNSPWRIHQTTDAPRGQDWFKKMAVLGEALESNLKIIRALNITAWDLDAVLHDQSAVRRTARSPYTKHKITIASADMAPFAPATQSFPVIRKAISDLHQLAGPDAPDIITFALSDGQDELGRSCFMSMLSGRSISFRTRYAV